MYIAFAFTKNRKRQNPLWLWNPEEMSPEIQNRGISGNKKGHVSTKIKKQNKTNTHVIQFAEAFYYYILFLPL